jgi:hypothetical protein
VVELSNGDVTSGLARPLAAEIDKSPFFDCRRKSHITRERYTIDPKHVLNTNRKPWSLYHLVTSLPVSDAPSGRNRDFAIIENPKNGYNYRMAPAKQEMCMEH